MRGGLVHRRESGQCVNPEVFVLDGGLAKCVDSRGIVEVSQGLGREEADLRVRALEARLESFDVGCAESLELHGRHAGGRGVEQLFAPGRRPSFSQLGTIDHWQELDYAEKVFLILVIKLGNSQHEETGGLGRRGTFLMSVFELMKSV